LTLLGNSTTAGAGWVGPLAFAAVKFGAAWTPTQIQEMDAALNP